jgi:hypothetical protein
MMTFEREEEKEDRRRLSILSKRVENVEGLWGESASPSDMWKIKIADVDENGVLIYKYAFAKVFVKKTDPSTQEKNIPCQNAGLIYEANVYKHIVSKKINPESFRKDHFVEMIDYFEDDIRFEDLLNFLEGKCIFRPNEFDLQVVSKENLRSHLVRNIQYAFCHVDGRPPIHYSGGSSHLTKSLTQRSRAACTREKIIKDFRFGFVLLEALPENFQSFCDWWMIEKKFRIDEEVLDVIHQVANICDKMSSVGLTHNDLHIRNVVVVSGITTTKTKRVIIYDFDRSFSTDLGKNKYLVGHPEFEKRCQRNVHIPNLDFVKFMSYIIGVLCEPEERKDFEKAAQNAFLEVICSSVRKRKRAIQIFNNGFFFIDPKTERSLHPLDFKDLFCEMDEMKRRVDYLIYGGDSCNLNKCEVYRKMRSPSSILEVTSGGGDKDEEEIIRLLNERREVKIQYGIL